MVQNFQHSHYKVLKGFKLMAKRYEVQVPEYITPIMLERIKEMMERGDIHPRHYSCDMTAEMAAGAPMGKALEEMVRRNGLKANDPKVADSIYQKLFPQKN